MKFNLKIGVERVKGEEEEGEIAFRKKLCFIGRLFKLFDETSRFVAVLSLSSLL